MREIQAAAIEQAVYDLILEASYNIGPDLSLPCEAEGAAALPEDVPADQTNT